MRLEQFEYVRVIAQCRSLSKAAKQLYLTQPTLSVSLQNLEAELGFPIFLRSRSGMTLTEKGEALYQIALRIQRELDEVKKLSQPEKETMRVELAAAPAFCNSAMLFLLRELKDLSPHLELSVREISRRDILSLLTSQQCHLAIGLYTAGEESQLRQAAAQSRIVIQPLVSDQMAVFLPKNHRLSEEPCIRLFQLEGERVILLRESEEQAEKIAAHHTQIQSYTFTERDSVLKAVSKGMGYAILPELMALDNLYVETGLITVIPLAEGSLPATLYLAYPADLPLTGNERLIIRALTKVCGDIRLRLAQRFPPAQGERVSQVELDIIY